MGGVSKNIRKLPPVIRVDEHKCINCHACITACPVKLCMDGSGSVIKINHDLCIGCGNCIHACTHGARSALDDAEAFFESARRGERFIAIAAPSVVSNFPGAYLNLNGFLRSLGASAVFDASFGAELTAESLKNYNRDTDVKALITQPCPAIVTFIEIYHPELLPYLAPFVSPVLHTIRMIRTFFPEWDGYRVVFISPCGAKRREFHEESGLHEGHDFQWEGGPFGNSALHWENVPHDGGRAQQPETFNVLFTSILAFLRHEGKRLADYPEAAFDGPSPERASSFSTPGGLLQTIDREIPGIWRKTRVVEGETVVYKYLEELRRALARETTQGSPDSNGSPETSPLSQWLIDCLNCSKGCNGGPGAVAQNKQFNELEAPVRARTVALIAEYVRKTGGERLAGIIGTYWKAGLYDKSYADLSANINFKRPSEREFQAVMLSMGKNTEKDHYNCSSCGYGSCADMAYAIFNGINKSQNCHHYDLLLLEEAKAKAEATTLTKSAFLANTSHEIRTPMNAILGMCELALREERNPEILEFLGSIKQAGNNLLTIVNDILDISKIEAGKLTIVNTEYSPATLINDCIAVIRVRLAEKPVCFVVDADPRIPARCLGDVVRIRQVLTNLLSNAVKYTKEGSILFRVECDIFDNLGGQRRAILLKFAVTDTGIGIKKEDAGDLFGNFNRFDQQHTSGIEGTGLGLAISRNLCRLMDGDITVESVYGQGSTFRADIPQTALTDEPLAAVKNAEAIAALVYDTRALSAESLKTALGRLGVRGVVAETKGAFLALLETGSFQYAVFPVSLMREAEDVLRKRLARGQPSVTPILLADSNGVSASGTALTVMTPAYAAPLADAINGVKKPGRDATTPAAFTCPTAKILAVDDLITNLKVIRGLLAPYKCEIDLCVSGKDAVRRVADERYDLVFMDQMMPEMDGTATLKAIRVLPVPYAKDIPVAVLSANALHGAKEQFLGEGFNDYLAKPIEIALLSEIMDKWIPASKKVTR
jgi:CheY-like chemotaxis protein/nitrogen-specific signal transduction histidine kinase/Pyruvate/2-oxoacid:ferredoxin oxidoreductase delta subunit